MRAASLGTILLAGALLAAAGCGSSSSSSTSSPAAPTTPTAPTPTTPLPSVADMMADKTLGSATAPVTMVEYSSLTCPHCADFHATTLPLLRSTYVDTGRVRYIYRDFPLNEPAIVAAMVARCSGDRYFAVLGALYSAQATWASVSAYLGAIKTVVSAHGMTASDVDACVAMTDLRAAVLAERQAATTSDGVSATPTFIINGRQVVGAQPFQQFAAIIDGF
jgi:protein-disulfide isomerase